jgi:putative flippase GtrA
MQMQNQLTSGAYASTIGDQLMTDRLVSAERRIQLIAFSRQFSKFLTVGLATAIVHYGILVVMVEACAIDPVWATTVGFLVAVLLSYLLNRRYTFGERPAFHLGLFKYYVAGSVGLALNAGVMSLLTGWGIYYLFAQIVASGVALIWNFLAARFVVFRRGRDDFAADICLNKFDG